MARTGDGRNGQADSVHGDLVDVEAGYLGAGQPHCQLDGDDDEAQPKQNAGLRVQQGQRLGICHHSNTLKGSPHLPALTSEMTITIKPASATVMRNTWRCTHSEYSRLRTLRHREQCLGGGPVESCFASDKVQNYIQISIQIVAYRQRQKVRVGLWDSRTMNMDARSHTAVMMSEPITNHCTARIAAVVPKISCTQPEEKGAGTRE